ncbi:hypothetical protein DSO57_1030834 [Entomophthora muscae]|uniref:Uncharacterized protein n=1 Tax=Entomophthora muscae TaxID=34485 RepID=A0ACC2UAG4_9FUNG|nr:hypothetical protein DSO57_1030834 [Entomophthora muscae]
MLQHLLNQHTKELFSGREENMQYCTESTSDEVFFYGIPQPMGPSPSTTQESFLSSSLFSMDLCVHHAQATINQNHATTLSFTSSQSSQDFTQRNKNPGKANQMP